MLDLLMAALATFGPEFKDEAVARLVDALLGSDNEMRERLERIESKVDILLNQSAGTAHDLLSDAMKPHRSPDDARALVEQARLEFTKAVNSSTDHLSRSVAGLWVAICWLCLMQPEDARDWAARAATEVHDSLYELAVEFNSSSTRAWPDRDYCVTLTQLIKEANGWALAVRSIRKILGTPDWNMPFVMVKYARRRNNHKYIFACIDASLYPRMTLGIGGVRVTFEQFDISKSAFIDTKIVVALLLNHNESFRILNQKPANRHERPDKLPVLGRRWAGWIILSVKGRTVIEGWRRFARANVVGGDCIPNALVVEPRNKKLTLIDPRPDIAVTFLCRSPTA